MNIYDIPIALITQQYLEYVEMMQELNLDTVGEFLVMAATLIHIKSKMLLPRPDRPTTDEPEEDPREALVRRLLEHQKFKAAAELLHERAVLRGAQWIRPDGRIAEIAGDEYAYEPEIEVDLFSLLAAFRGVLERAKQRPKMLLPPEEVPVEVRIEQLLGDAVGDRGLRLRGSVREGRHARRDDRDVPGAARDDSPQADPRVPDRGVRSDPRLQARAPRGRADADW